MDIENCPLPLEILEIIFEEVKDREWQSKKIFRACILVSSTFRHLAIKRLYETVRLMDYKFTDPAQTEKEAEKITRFKELIAYPSNFRFSNLIHCIKSFDLSLRCDPVNDNLLSIIRTLSGDDCCMTQLSLRGPSWNKLPRQLQSALQSLIQSPHVATLEISFDEFPAEILRGSQLQILESYSIISDSEGQHSTSSDVAPEALPYPALEALRIHASCEFNTSLQSPLRELQKLFVNLVGRDMTKGIKKFIRQTRHTLQDVEIRSISCVSAAEAYDTFNVISPMLQLKTIKLDLYHHVLTRVYRDNPIPEEANSFFLQSLEDGGDTLDRFLAGPNYPSLRVLDINVALFMTVDPLCAGEDIDVDCTAEENKHTEAITDSILRVFPRLTSSSEVSLKLNVEVDIDVCY